MEKMFNKSKNDEDETQNVNYAEFDPEKEVLLQGEEEIESFSTLPRLSQEKEQALRDDAISLAKQADDDNSDQPVIPLSMHGDYPVFQVIICDLNSITGTLSKPNVQALADKHSVAVWDVIHDITERLDLLPGSDQDAIVKLMHTKTGIVTTCWSVDDTLPLLKEYASLRNSQFPNLQITEKHFRVITIATQLYPVVGDTPNNLKQDNL